MWRQVALGSITMNKASGGDGIAVELLQILKDDAIKVLHSICQEIGELSSGHTTGEGQYSHEPKEGSNAKECSNYPTVLISQASKVRLQIFQKLGFNNMWTENFQMYKLDFEKAEESEIKLPTSIGS